MATIRPEERVTTELYNKTAAARSELDEANDCGVIALAVVAEISYAEARDALAAEGRIPREGTTVIQLARALKKLGKKLIQVEPQAYIADYHGCHAELLKTVTTHHPRRFYDVWNDDQDYLFFSAGHVTAVRDGVNHDWTKGRARRVRSIYAVVPLKAKMSKYLANRCGEVLEVE